jgi:hypothetical protein
MVIATCPPEGGQDIMNETSVMRVLFCAAAALCLTACGGGEVGGTLSGLGSGLSVTLLNNDTDALTLTRNGSFTFANGLAANKGYAVTVKTQPVGQLCDVTNATGTVNAQADSIDTVRVACANSASLTGTVSGLLAGTAVTLGNGDERLPLTTNGAFAFPGKVSAGTAYEVVVVTQPLGTTCAVANGAGTFVENLATNVAVTCN